MDETPPSNEQPSPIKPRTRLLPRWWWGILLFGISISYVVSLVERAASQLVLNATIFLAVLLLLLRYFFRGGHKFVTRAAPLLLFCAVLGVIIATVRVDDMNGNLIPTRVSFRWQKQRDELLEFPEAVADPAGIDLSATSSLDFPRFLGPDNNGSVNVALGTDWDAQPPELVWSKSEFGAGWSGFAAVNGYAVTLEQRGENEIVSCYEIATGDLAWSHAEQARHLTVPGGIGPRSTPTIYNGRVYTIGATGILLCLDGGTGDVVWKRNLQDEIGTTTTEELNRIAWGRSASPLIDQGRVIVPLGMPDGATIAAFDAVNGDSIWKQGDHQISYASPQALTIDGIRQIVLVCESEICGHHAQSGELLWEFPWPGASNGSASCSQTLQVDGNRLFFSKGYAHGAALVEIRQSPSGWNLEKVWHRRTVMKTKFTNPVLHDGHVYGLDDGILSCVDLETGKRTWKRGRYGHGQVLKTATALLVQAESGDVVLVDLDPTRFNELTRFSPLDGKTWNNPCLYGNRLLVRNGEQAACYLLPVE